LAGDHGHVTLELVSLLLTSGRSTGSGRSTESATAPTQNGGRLGADRLLLLATLVCTVLACAPFFRYVLWLGDEGIVLNGAEKILRGERIYRDFFEFLPPGSFLIGAAWMQLIGPSFASIRVLAIGVIVACAGLTYVAIRQASRSPGLAALLTITWVVQSQGSWMVISHHWFSTAASMASAAALFSALTTGGTAPTALRLAGFFAGIAAMMTPVQGAFLCLAALGLAATRPDRRRAVVGVVGGVAIFPLATLAYLGATDAIGSAFYDIIVFPAQHYADVNAVRYGAFTEPHSVAAMLFLPLTLVLTAAAAILDRQLLWRDPRCRAALALALVAVPSVFPRPDISHINFVLPLAFPLFAIVTPHLLRGLGPVRRPVGLALIALAVVVAGYAAYKKIVPIVLGPLREVSTARGVFVATPSPWIDVVAALVAEIERTPPADGFFFYPYSPMLPYLTAREHVAPIDIMIPGYTTPEQYRAVCLRVVRDARWIVIDRSWTNPLMLKAVYPNMRIFDPPEMREFEAAMRLAFDQVVHASPVFELRRRGANASERSCWRI